MTIEYPAAPMHSANRPRPSVASRNGLDLVVAIGLIAAGAVALALDRSAGMMTPSLEGGLTTSVLAVALCGVARIPYRATLATVLALVLIGLAAGLAVGLPATAILGYPLVALGILGVLENHHTVTSWRPHPSRARLAPVDRRERRLIASRTKGRSAVEA